MTVVAKLIEDVATARNSYLKQIESVSEETAQWKPNPDEWNIVEITEHLFWAEQGAIFGMWKTIKAIRNGKADRRFESDHQGMSIEKIIKLTWKEKEQVPAVAAPRMGGALSFWSASFKSLQSVLKEFGHDLKDDELRLLAHPHPISGAMDFQQRLEFLRFHINRHKGQVSALLEKMA